MTLHVIHSCVLLRRRQWQPTPVLLPGKSHGWRSLVGCSPWDHWESDTTERLRFHFSFSCTGEGNGNPLQCSCLENPRDGRAWWAAVYGVAQSRTRLKRLSSSSSDYIMDSIDLDWVLWDQGFYSVPHTIRHSGNWLWVSYHHACLKITAGYSLLQTLSWVEKKV